MRPDANWWPWLPILGRGRHTDLVGVVTGPLLAMLLLAAVIVWVQRVLVPNRRGLLALPAIVLPLLTPFLIPVDWVYTRAFFTVSMVVMAGKAWELVRDRVPDPRMLERLGTLCFWLLIPPKATLPQSLDAAAKTRAQGRRRLVRALLKLPGVALLTLVHLCWPQVHDNVWLEAFWALWLTYLAVSGVIDVFSGLAMQTGIPVAEAFDTPPLARSPRDFWGKRWNLIVHDMMFRHVFLPMGGLRRPLRSTLAVFLFSGLVHEYFVFAALGHPSRYTGFMLAFFTVHGIAVLVQLAWDRGPGRRKSMRRPLAIGLHLAWFTLTAPLFFAPIGEIFARAWPN